MKITFALLTVLAFTACKGPSTMIDEGSKLSTITVNKFQPKAGAKNWSSMKVTVTNTQTGQEAFKKASTQADFSTGSDSVEMKLKFGSYTFVLEYFDKDNQTLLYRSCQDSQKKDPVKKIEGDIRLEVDLCVMNVEAGNVGDVAGNVGDEASVTIVPELKEQEAGTSAGNTAGIGATPVAAGNFLTVYAPGSTNGCVSLTNAKFGDVAIKKSYLCSIYSTQVPQAGFYLKGSIKISVVGKSGRVTVSGFGLADPKNWSAREGAALKIDETIQVELGRANCNVARPAAGFQVGTVLVYTDAGGDLTFNEFMPVGFSKVSCN